jgi:hypothetical protein
MRLTYIRLSKEPAALVNAVCVLSAYFTDIRRKV